MIRNKFISLVIFLNIIICSLIVYLFVYRDNSCVFWILSILSAVIILTQIHYGHSKKELNIIYIEIIGLYLTLRLIPVAVVGYNGIFGLDTYYELSLIHEIVNTGYWVPYTLFGPADTVSGYPMIHFLGSILSVTTNIKIEYLSLVISTLLNVIILLMFILIGKNTFKNDRVTLLSCLGFIFLFLFVDLSFVRTTISLCYFFMAFYLMMKKRDVKISFLIIMILIAMIYSHPIAPVVLLIFTVILLIFNKIYDYKDIPILNRLTNVFNFKLNKEKHINSNLFLLCSVLIVAYFVYISVWQQQQLLVTFNILKGIETVHSVGSGVGTPLNWRIFLYGQLVMMIVFTLMFLGSKKARKNSNSVLLMFFGINLAIISFIAYLFNLDMIRFTVFYWPFILLSSSYVIFNFKSKIKTILSFTIILFIVFNMAGYSINTYDMNYLPPSGICYEYTTVQENAAVSSIQPNGYIVSNQYFNMITLLRNESTNLPDAYDFFIEGYKGPNKYKYTPNYFFVEKDDIRSLFIRGAGNLNLPYDTYLKYQNSTYLLKIYDNGKVNVFNINY